MSLDELAVAAQIPGPASARIRLLGDRRVSWFEFEPRDPAAPLTQEMTAIMERAVRTALDG